MFVAKGRRNEKKPVAARPKIKTARIIDDYELQTFVVC